MTEVTISRWESDGRVTEKVYTPLTVTAIRRRITAAMNAAEKALRAR